MRAVWMREQRSRRRGTTIWTQVLLIALVPSVAIVLVGAALATYLVRQGLQVSGFADDVRGALDPISRFVVAVQEERRLTVMHTGEARASTHTELEAQRRRVDEAMADMEITTRRLAADAPEDLRTTLNRLTDAAHGVPAMRERIDSGAVDSWQAYNVLNDMLDLCGVAIQGIARSASDAEIGFEQLISYDLFKSAEAMSRAHSMAVRAVESGLTGPQFHEMAHQLGMYHEQVESVVPRMTPQEQRTYADLKKTPEWAALVAGDDSLMARGPELAAVSFDVPTWENAARKVGDGLIGLYVSHSRHAANLATARGNATFVASILAGTTILVIALASVFVALRLSRRLVTRLRALRHQTLDLAHAGLPRMVATIQAGQPIDLEKQVAWLDFGTDEVGQVADAFNNAQRTAIGAAVREAETRQGVRSVFLNIARRSQVIVHRQLKVLDKAERSVEDPDHLQVLFQLDHLATRSRRNAENLIILAGEQPGRQWRNPVSLRDIVRGAIAETEQYTRINASQLPDVLIVGNAVADIVHLLAELIDNAAAFSPQDSRVQVRGNLAGRGIVLEVEDQGLGIAPAKLEELNETLRNPPDFNVMALSSESRVGLFVVARLAARHDVRISLRDSDYGGTRTIVLIPASRIATAGPAEAPEPAAPRGGDTVVSRLPRPRENGSRPSPSAGPGPAKPPLPRRQRQANLTPQLAGDPESRPEPVAGEEETLRRSERSRRTMAAFQNGTRQARSTGDHRRWEG
jgi:signal transduction histidine kinase